MCDKRLYKSYKVKEGNIRYWFIKRVVILFLPFTFSFSPALSQEVIPASGGNAPGSGGSVSYSVGQLFFTIGIGSNGSVILGVQQPYEISVISGIEEGVGITLNCSAYPNPTADFLILKIEGDVMNQCIASLYDVNGRLLESRIVEGRETTFDMSRYFQAVYFLKVVVGSRTLKTFKIVKH